jgi:hypothetical protein
MRIRITGYIRLDQRRKKELRNKERKRGRK